LAFGATASSTVFALSAAEMPVVTPVEASIETVKLVIGDIIAVNGVCLTVIEIENESFTAAVSQETLNCSIFGDLSMGDAINLEKALRLNQGIDGHLVSGHVDGQGEVTDKALEGESMRFRINVAQSLVKYIARKGSITVNGGCCRND
jgi:riboflavin synthase